MAEVRLGSRKREVSRVVAVGWQVGRWSRMLRIPERVGYEGMGCRMQDYLHQS